IFLIRLLELYALALVSFVVYFFKVPERIFSGKFDLVGASHQLWHCMVVVILYHCHTTGMMYIQIRINMFCPDHPLYNTVSYNTT
ncbi:unnamed protein product, partial [Timema podura]|nr:unnamed protein product [Timema podura]